MRLSLSSILVAALAGTAQANDNLKDEGSSSLRATADQSHRSLMPFQTFVDKGAWEVAAGTPSWTVDFSYDVTTSFLTGPIDVPDTDGNTAFELKTNGDITNVNALNFRISATTDEARLRPGETEPTATMTFENPVKAWGAVFRGADDMTRGIDIDIEVVCPGETIMLSLTDNFAGFVLKEQAATAIVFRATGTDNTFYMDDVVGVTGTKGGGSWGDPHFATWGNHWFDFMGECDMMLLQVLNFVGDLALTIHGTFPLLLLCVCLGIPLVDFTVHSVFSPQHYLYYYSYITSAAVQIGDETLEVASYAEYFLNGVDLASSGALNMELNGFPVVHEKVNKKRDKFDIMIGQNENITLSVYKDLVSVDIVNGSPEHFGNSVGLMGSFHTEKMLGRDGQTVLEDETAFANEWQVRDNEPVLFQTVRAPQYPQETCRLPTKSQMEVRRRLGEDGAVNKAAAEKACAHVSEDRKKACIFDVMAMQDVDAAEGY